MIKQFDSIQASTKTIILVTNLVININDLYDFLPYVEHNPIQKRRGRKKKNVEVVVQKPIPPGTITSIGLGDKTKGIPRKKKKKDVSKKSIDYFLNSISIGMHLEDKYVSFKISKNGKIQIVGCKSWKSARDCVHYIWNYIKDNKQLYSYTSGETLKIIFLPAMRNIVFSTNFIVDREQLNRLINVKTPYTSILETSFSYTGVNVKIPILDPITKIDTLYSFDVKDEKDWEVPNKITYEEYIRTLPEREQNKIMNKERYTTFLVFHSGKCIMSSIHKVFMRSVYYDFLNFIFENKGEIEEKLTIT